MPCRDAAGNDSALIPVAIELAHDETHKDGTIPRTAGVVYSRSSLAGDLTTAPVWRLAKAVFKSLDESYHQVPRVYRVVRFDKGVGLVQR